MRGVLCCAVICPFGLLWSVGSHALPVCLFFTRRCIERKDFSSKVRWGAEAFGAKSSEPCAVNIEDIGSYFKMMPRTFLSTFPSISRPVVAVYFRWRCWQILKS